MGNNMREEDASPEVYRQRYFALKEQGQKGSADISAELFKQEERSPKDIHVRDSVPTGWYWGAHISRGQTLRIINDGGNACVSALFWNAVDPSERLNPADTIKVQWTAHIEGGRLLLSDMGRVLASITRDTCGFHDCLAGGSTPASNGRKYGPSRAHRNTRDNFILVASKHGLSSRDVGPCISFFAPVVTDQDGKLVWRDGVRPPGDYVDLRAEVNLLVALSNCPHPLDPETNWRCQTVSVVVWQDDPAAENDYCRVATGEARRAFENTARVG
jgi:uncharacterized protein